MNLRLFSETKVVKLLLAAGLLVDLEFVLVGVCMDNLLIVWLIYEYCLHMVCSVDSLMS